MASLLPLTLSGDNLGQRHQELNSHVRQAAASHVSFQNIAALPEHDAVDRLFKIDLANKLQNVDYILDNIKDDDMLYVSRALKCKWLLERRDIMNPKYLESVLFPEMVMPAIAKLKHWLYINLRDPLMCQEFYQYYKDNKFDFAVKFLSRSDNDFIMNELPKILSKITPHYLKVLAEKEPKLVKVYFDALATDNELVKRYLQEEASFYSSIKCVLKRDANLFLDITEKYYNLSSSNKLSASATDYILRSAKDRFLAKPELYMVYLLHIPTLAQRLPVEECQDLVMKLARAEYISWWFSYDKVEPLVKRVSRDCRAAFKKRVFVDKDVGERVAEYPYALPTLPVATDTSSEQWHVFDDREFEPIYKVSFFHERFFKAKKRRVRYESDNLMRCGTAFAKCAAVTYGMSNFRSVKSELQKLFDEFRFVGFESTLHELKGRIAGTSSADRRRDMLLVLVSKSGGRVDSVRALLQLALRLRNEPVQGRAAILRSLVKRASAWRLPQDVWDTILEYGHGLGLDGTKPEADCHEGLHAVVLRQLIATGECDPKIRAAFLEAFSTFDEYKLVANERAKVCTGLQRMLVSAVADVEPEVAATRLDQLLDLLQKYQNCIRSSPVVPAVAALSERDFKIAQPLLMRLYKARVGRRELLRLYLKFLHDDAALQNALRHDPEVIPPEWIVNLLSNEKVSANRFLLKLAVYFSEPGGIAEKVRQGLIAKIAQEPDVKLARSLAILAGGDMMSLCHEQNGAGDGHVKLAAALRASMHYARPAPDALALGWHKAGMTAVAWRAMRCRPSQVTQLTQMLLKERSKRTVRLALVLAQRTECPADIFSAAMTIRPLAALRAALPYFRNAGDTADLRIWDMVKPLVSTANLAPREGLRNILKNVEWVPTALKPDYCAILYLALNKISDRNSDYILSVAVKYLSEITDDLLEKVLLQVLENMNKENPVSYPALVIMYLMLSKNEDELKTRTENILEPFLVKLDAIRVDKNMPRPGFFSESYDQIINSLRYNSAFFDMKYQNCLIVIERVLTWMHNFMPKETYFKQYIKIHTTMLYYKAVRQSMKQRPEIFQDLVKKRSEGVEIVAFTFGRYVVKELAELKSKYFDSVIELYRNVFVEYLQEYFLLGTSREKFVTAITKGIITESVGPEGRFAVHIMRHYEHYTSKSLDKEVRELLLKSEDKETQFFLHADYFL